MSVAETILEKLNVLAPADQERVLQFVETISAKSEPSAKVSAPYAWIDIALTANLQGPPDWSEHLDDYLYGDRKNAR